jgi:hypothetical protein
VKSFFIVVVGRPSVAAGFGRSNLLLENQPRLDLKHPRRINVSERRNSVSVGAYGSGRHKPAKRRRGCWIISIDGHAAAEVIAVIEQIETFEPKQQAHALVESNPILNEYRNF